MQTNVIADIPPNGDMVRVPFEPPSLSPLALIEKAIDKGVHPDQLGKLLDLQERWDRARAAERFAEAVTAFQSEVPAVMKKRSAGKEDTKFGTYKFASYDDVMEAAAPVLARHGVVVTFTTEQDQQRLRIVCRVRVGTHVEETPFSIPIPAMNVNETQKFGAALSYGKRYALCAALNIVIAHEDPDAEALFENVTEQELKELRALAEERNINVPAFLKVLKITSENLADIPRDRFNHAVSLMKQKPIAKKEAAK